MLIHRLQFMKEDYKEDLTIYQQQLSQVLQSLAPSFQNPRYTHARDPNERNKKLLKKVSQVISGYLTRFGKSYVHLVFLLQKFFSMGAPTNSGARGPPTAKSGPVPLSYTEAFYTYLCLTQRRFISCASLYFQKVLVLTRISLFMPACFGSHHPCSFTQKTGLRQKN